MLGLMLALAMLNAQGQAARLCEAAAAEHRPMRMAAPGVMRFSGLNGPPVVISSGGVAARAPSGRGIDVPLTARMRGPDDPQVSSLPSTENWPQWVLDEEAAALAEQNRPHTFYFKSDSVMRAFDKRYSITTLNTPRGSYRGR